MPSWRLLEGDVREQLRELPDGSIHCVMTSPPYFGLRDYGTGTWEGGEEDCDHIRRKIVLNQDFNERWGQGGGQKKQEHRTDPYRNECGKCGATWVDRQVGLESSPTAYVQTMVEVFREVRRVLRDDGTCWLNLGDSYASDPAKGYGGVDGKNPKAGSQRARYSGDDLKPKDLCMIPARVALALQADGWWLRSDIVWCLSGGTRVYARTQKGEMPTTIKDLVRLDPSTVQLWNGEKWTQVLGWNESERGEPLEIELRSGQRVGCTPHHVWPTQRGDVRADELIPGDIIRSCRLPEPSEPYNPIHIDERVAWLIGLYLAEGSWSGDTIQLAGHIDETDARIDRLRPTVEAFGGTIRGHAVKGNAAMVVIECPALAAVIRQYVRGHNAKTKGLRVRVWRHGDDWLGALLWGYLWGDGHDRGGGRWRLGFTRNDDLANDLRTLAARLGYSLTLKATTGKGFGEMWPIYRGEICKTRSGHHNEKDRGEVIRIGRSRARKFWDIGVEDAPHLFTLASGILTHNSKSNPMPESVTDRPTRAHEFIFLLTKAERYFYDSYAVREPSTPDMRRRAAAGHTRGGTGESRDASRNDGDSLASQRKITADGRNKRDVWVIATKPFPEAHFAVFPPELVEPCVKAGSSEHGCCAECGAPYRRVVEKVRAPDAKSGKNFMRGAGHQRDRVGGPANREGREYEAVIEVRTTAWDPTCSCAAEIVPCTVLDPFAGSGTTLLMANRLGRDAVGVELSPEYAAMIRRRLRGDMPLFAAEME